MNCTIEYDLTLDDLGHAKRGYWWDPRHIYLLKEDGEWGPQIYTRTSMQPIRHV